MSHFDPAQPYPHAQPEPLMPFRYLRDLAIHFSLISGLVAAGVAYLVNRSSALSVSLFGILIINATAAGLLLRASHADSIGFRVWSAMTQLLAMGALGLSAYLVLEEVRPMRKMLLLVAPALAGGALAFWLLVVKRVERRPFAPPSQFIASTAIAGSALGAVPLFVAESIVGYVGYLLLAVFLSLSIILFAVDVRSLWRFKQGLRWIS